MESEPKLVVDRWSEHEALADHALTRAAEALEKFPGQFSGIGWALVSLGHSCLAANKRQDA